MKGKKIFLILLIIVCVICLSYVFSKENKTSPENTLKQYISYIEEKNYEEMYNLVITNATKEDYISRNKNIYEGIEASNIDINVAKVMRKSANDAEIIYTTTMDTVAGSISFSNTANLVKENDIYKIKWSSNLIFPSLNDNYKVRVNAISAKRGEILDRTGKVLAGEQTASEIGLVPGKMNTDTKERDIQKISELLDINIETINNNLSASYVKDDTFVPLKTILKSEVELKTKLLDIKGIKIIDSEERIYPLGEASSQLLGYVQVISSDELKDNKNKGYTTSSIIGKTGLEKIYEDKLRAIEGAEIYIVNEDGKKVKTIAKRDATNGENVKLTIDSEIQQNLYEQFKEDKSASVAINPKTGEILALVSTPTFNSNDFSLGITTNKWNNLVNDENKPLYNRFLASYVPGSSMKPITGGIGLSTNAFTAEEDFGKSGTKWQKDDTWKDFYVTTLQTYNGTANLRNALVYSDNIYFAKAALKIGKDQFAKSLQTMKFGKQIETPVGSVNSSFSNSYSFETETTLANSGYGQAEMLVNPIHMAMLYSAFVNDGNMVKLYIEYKENKQIEYEVKNIFTKSAANTIKEDLIQVVEDSNGTAHSVKTEGLVLAAKTGTAEVKASKEDKDGTEIGWFNCFIADENNNEQLMIISMVENVKNRGGSHYVANKVKAVIDKINIMQ